MSEFKNKRTVVTGAAGTVGRVVAQAFHDAGASVTGVDIVEYEAPYRTLVADLIDPEGARAAVSEIGEIDILANIAGGFTMGDTIAETSDDTWDFMMNLNARTVLNMTRAVRTGHGSPVGLARSSTSAPGVRCAVPPRWVPTWHRRAWSSG